jgi:hypothetical protein
MLFLQISYIANSSLPKIAPKNSVRNRSQRRYKTDGAGRNKEMKCNAISISVT